MIGAGHSISGQKVKELRERKVMSVLDVSRKSGLSVSTIHNIERGKQGALRIKTIQSLATAFDMSPEQFMSEVQDQVDTKPGSG